MKFGTKQCCEALQVSRSGYYQWRQAVASQRTREEDELVKQIKEIFAAHKGRYGSPRVTPSVASKGGRLWRESRRAADASK